MRDRITDLLDVLGLLLVAAGIGALTFPWLGWACLAVVGLVILVGSQLAAWLGSRALPDRLKS